MPRHSIVIPCFNAARHLSAALASCLAQTDGDWEVVAVDDGSVDGTSALLAAAAARDPRIRVITQANAGVGPARNVGLATARGDYVCFLDADDELEPAKLERQGAVLAANPGIGLVTCDGVVVDDAGVVLFDSLVDSRDFVARPPLFDALFAGGLFPPVVPLVRTALARQAGGFSAERESAGWADTEFWMRVALAGGGYHHLSERLVRYRRTNGSMSADGGAMEAAAHRVYARLMREQPERSAVALRRLQVNWRDLRLAQDLLRQEVSALAHERDLLRSELGAATARQAAAESELARWRPYAVEAFELRLRHLAACGRPLAVWGAGSGGRRALEAVRRAGAVVGLVIDRDPAKHGGLVGGVPVEGPAAVLGAGRGNWVVVIASAYAGEIARGLEDAGWRADDDYLVLDLSLLAASEARIVTTNPNI